MIFEISHLFLELTVKIILTDHKTFKGGYKISVAPGQCSCESFSGCKQACVLSELFSRMTKSNAVSCLPFLPWLFEEAECQLKSYVNIHGTNCHVP